MRSEIYILCILLLINTFLTIYLVYHCFKSPIVEGLDVIGAISSGVNDGLSKAERELQRLKELEVISAFFGKVVKSLDSLYSSLKDTVKKLKDYE
jgi:nitrate/nitrite-specific signal transduction histidine kinase